MTTLHLEKTCLGNKNIVCFKFGNVSRFIQKIIIKGINNLTLIDVGRQ